MWWLLPSEIVPRGVPGCEAVTGMCRIGGNLLSRTLGRGVVLFKRESEASSADERWLDCAAWLRLLAVLERWSCCASERETTVVGGAVGTAFENQLFMALSVRMLRLRVGLRLSHASARAMASGRVNQGQDEDRAKVMVIVLETAMEM